ncbi:NPC intracellular cholesterol transporter 1-like [Brevipalpus obovatus]|uniref:NPC intracellular cholesterol transporter 1-like n=1 Tax=Brevipalpus obovatus TaxID=246614 RepID=UPI003D9DF38D
MNFYRPFAKIMVNLIDYIKLLSTILHYQLLIGISNQARVQTKRCSLTVECKIDTLTCSRASNYSAPLTPAANQLLKDECPSLFKSTDGGNQETVTVCCSSFDVHRLKLFLSYYKSAFSCTACWLNFKELFCQLVCSPNQGDFVKILKIRSPWALSLDKELYIWVEYYLTESFAKGIYDSCKDMPTAEIPAISPTCSPRLPKCNLRLWLNLMTYRVPTLYDYRINLNFNLNLSAPLEFRGDYTNPLDRQAYPCDEKMGKKMVPCSISECKNVCLQHKPNTHAKMVSLAKSCEPCEPCEKRKISPPSIDKIWAQSSVNRISLRNESRDHGKRADSCKICEEKCDQSQNLTYKNIFLSEKQYFSYLGEFIISACAFTVICLVLIAIFVLKFSNRIEYGTVTGVQANRMDFLSYKHKGHDRLYETTSFAGKKAMREG